MLHLLITLLQASEDNGIPYVTLKAAAQRWKRTGGKLGLESVKPKYARDYMTTQAAVDTFVKSEYNPRLKHE